MSTIDTILNLKEVILSILFVSGDGIEKSFIAEKLQLSDKEVSKAIEELKMEYNGDKGIHIIEYKNKVQLASNPNYANYISDVLNPIREKSLTRAALETLAIIAYKQPITKLEIEDIRRVNSDYAVQNFVANYMDGRDKMYFQYILVRALSARGITPSFRVSENLRLFLHDRISRVR